jgi:hypothetical protein
MATIHPTKPASRHPNGDGRKSTGLISIAPTLPAGDVWAPAETEPGATAPPPANRKPTANGEQSASASAPADKFHQVNPALVTFANARRNTPDWPEVECEWCHGPFIPKRPWARFCNTYCRQQAWYRAQVIGNEAQDE